jgi:hypothetical protein
MVPLLRSATAWLPPAARAVTLVNPDTCSD